MSSIDLEYIFSDDISKKEWIGEVIDNDDPEKEFRCKVKVFGLFDELEKEYIPWCYPANNSIFSKDGFGNGSVPKIGSIVKVRFNNNNLYSPEYYSIQNIDEELIKEISDSYLNTHVLLFDSGEKVKILFTTKNGIKIANKNSEITIKNEFIELKNQNNKIIINNNGNINLSNENVEINLLNSGNLEIKTNIDINITCNNANIKANGNINLGNITTEKIINGLAFMTLFNTHTHIAYAPGAPTSPPITPMTTELLNKFINIK